MFSDPEKNVKELYIKDGMVVADLGAGTGAYSIASGRAMGNSGTVYAVEIQKDFLSKVKNSAIESGVNNVEVLWGDIEEVGGTKIGDNLSDRTIVSNVLFQVENKEGLMAEAYRITKSGGKMLVVDWSESFGGIGPQPGDVFPETEAMRIASEAGFTFDRKIDAGTHHYGIILNKGETNT